MTLAARRLTRLLLVGLLSLLVLPFIAAPAGAGEFGRPQAAKGPHLTVATYNLYLGADLGPLFAARTPAELAGAAATVYANMEATQPAERMRAIARLLSRERPDVVGLQEVARWEAGPLGGELTTTYDFLDLLLQALAHNGTPYVPVATNENFTGQLPTGATTQARFTDRDVILVRAGHPYPRVTAANPTSGRFAAELTIPSGIPGLSFDVPRGWSTVDVTVRGRTARVINTHLEAFVPPIRDAQATELVPVVEASPYPVVLVGDLNSTPSDSTGAYGIVRAAGLADAWRAVHGSRGGFTFGQAPDLRNVPSTMDSRIDFVLYERRYLRALRAEVLGESLRDRTASGLWPSDHAGVVARFAFRY